MSWERRAGRGWCYTKTKRVNGKVVREYFVAGPEAPMRALDAGCRLLTRAALVAAGSPTGRGEVNG